MNNKIKKLIAIGATASMVLWTLGTALPVGAVTIADGDLVKTADSSGVYYIQGANKRVFPHANVYSSWGFPSDFSTVKVVTASELSAYADANAMPFRDGALFRGVGTGLSGYAAEAVYYVEDSKIRPVQSEAIYQALFNDASWSKVTWVPDDLLAKFTYDLGSMVESSSTHPDGSLVRYTGETQIYVIENGQKRAISDAAFTANRYRSGDVVDISSGETYADGSAVTGVESGLLTPGWTGITVAAALTASLVAVDGATLPDGASNVSVLSVRFTAGSSAVAITGLTFKRLGIGSAADWDAMYLYEGNTRITATSRTISSDNHQLEFPVLTISVSANSSKVITLRGDLTTGLAGGQIHSFQILSVDTSASVSGLPLTGNSFNVGAAGVDVSTVTVAAGAAPSNPSIGATSAEVATFRLTAGTNDVEFNQVVLSFTGSLSRAAVTNLKLYQESTLLASASSVASDDTVTFTLTSPYSISQGTNKTFRVKADISGEVTETLTTRLEEAGHLFVVDKQYNFGAVVSDGAGAYNAVALGTITLQGGELTMTDNGPVAGYISKNTQDVVLTSFAMTSQRAVEVRRLTVNICSNAAIVPGTTTFSDLRIKDADTGTTVMSKSSLTPDDNAAVAALSVACGTPNPYTLTDIFNLSAGVTRNFNITIDTGTSATLDNNWIRASVEEVMYDADQSYMRDVATGDYLYTADIVPNEITGDNQEVQAADLESTLSSTPVTALTVVRGGVKVEGVGVVLTSAEASATSLRQLAVRVYVSTDVTDPAVNANWDAGDESTNPKSVVTAVYLYDGTTLLDTKTLTNTTAGFDYGAATFDNLDLSIPAGTNKRLVVKFDISSASAARLVAIGVPGAGISAYDGEGNSLTINEDINLLTTGTLPLRYVRVAAAGNLTIAQDASTPDSAIIIAGSSDVVASKIKFTATNEDWTVDKLRVEVATSGNEGSISGVEIGYENKTVTGYLAGGYVNFTGLGWLIEQDTEEVLTISIDLADINPNVATTGRTIIMGVECAAVNECKAIGSSQTILGDGAAELSDADGNPMYLRKSKPAVTGLALPSTTLINGTNVINTFSVVSDANGAITLKKFSWDVNVSNAAGADVTVTTWKIYEGTTELAGATGGHWSDGTTTSSAGVVPILGASGATVLIVELDSEREIAAGVTKTFTLKGVVSGATVNDSISASLLNDDNDTAVQTDGLVNNDLQGVQLDDAGAVDFLWSDKARGVNHTDTMQDTYEDWTNGYLIDIMPTATKSLTWPS